MTILYPLCSRKIITVLNLELVISVHFSLSAAFLTDVSGDLYMGVSLGMVKSKHKWFHLS